MHPPRKRTVAAIIVAQPYYEGASKFDPASDITWNDIPLARRAIGSKPAWYDKAKFYERVEEVEQARSDFRDYLAIDKAKADAFLKENKALADLYRQATGTREALSNMRKARAAALLQRQKGTLPFSDYAVRVKKVDDDEKAAITNFNKRYVDTVIQSQPVAASAP